MEERDQEDDIKVTNPSTYGQQSSGGGGEERRKDGNNNGLAILTYPQTLDRHQRLVQGRSLIPDRLATMSIGSNSKGVHVRYRECLRNHAASVGGSVFDGCGEFMPGGEDGTLEALKCAACECHRNFHRKEVDGEIQLFSPRSRRSAAVIHSLQLPPPPPLPSPTVLHHHQRYPMTAANMVHPMSVAFGGSGGSGTESSSEDLNPEGIAPPPYILSKKRFRTKFTAEQKDGMMELAEKVGWRMNKQDEEEINRFCAEIGVRRQVFKVWMHNNKNLKKNQQEQEEQPLFE